MLFSWAEEDPRWIIFFIEFPFINFLLNLGGRSD